MLINAIEKANANIYRVSQEQPQCAGMGTTLVACIFSDNKLVIGHIGDSRLYRLRNQQLLQMTEDHSLLQEQLNSGLISVEDAKISSHKNLVTRALGVDLVVEPEVQKIAVEIGDLFLLCSDGLSDMVEDDLIEQILVEADGDVELAAANLIKIANESGGRDNISVAIAVVEKSFPAENGWVKNLFRQAKKPEQQV